ncbi:MAG: heme ABC exporter ATP-binding protein CcmA [Halieaceae bacterium]|nr:heme ABC exporter ATP-binding protein CcmA [Halieaceae bacterium]
MLQVRNAGCERDERLLFEDLSFSLSPGELLQVVGGNGSGKSTLLRVLLGLYTECYGDIDWGLDRPPLYLGHRLGIKQSLTVIENLRWFGVLREEAVNEARIEEAVYKLGLSGFEDSLCSHLSEGQRKRVALGQFLIIDNPCWVMDEPFSAIDADGLSFLMAILQEHLDVNGGIIISTHQPIAIDRPINTLALQ